MGQAEAGRRGGMFQTTSVVGCFTLVVKMVRNVPLSTMGIWRFVRLDRPEGYIVRIVTETTNNWRTRATEVTCKCFPSDAQTPFTGPLWGE